MSREVSIISRASSAAWAGLLKQLKQSRRPRDVRLKQSPSKPTPVERRTRMFTYTARSARIAPGTGQHRGIDATWSSCPPSLRDMATAAEILVVDDEPELCEMVAEYLMRHGFAVRTAMDGEAMAARLLEKASDLVILDINMPGEDGLTLARRLREHSDICIMMLTASGATVDRVVGLEMGADDYIAKPFDLRSCSRGSAPYCAVAPMRMPAAPGPSHHPIPSASGAGCSISTRTSLLATERSSASPRWSSTSWTPLPGTPTKCCRAANCSIWRIDATGSPSTAASISASHGSARRSSVTRPSRRSSRRSQERVTCM